MSLKAAASDLGSVKAHTQRHISNSVDAAVDGGMTDVNQTDANDKHPQHGAEPPGDRNTHQTPVYLSVWFTRNLHDQLKPLSEVGPHIRLKYGDEPKLQELIDERLIDQMMWMWRSVLCVSLVCGLALDSNTIRSSSSEQLDRSHGNQTETSANKRPTRPCATPDCYVPPVTDRLTTPGHNRAGCSNRAQRRTVPQDRQADRRRHKDTDTQQDTDSFNRTKAPEMSSCVRSGDCAAGLCCVRYLTGRRCQRIPGEGEACLLRGSSKQKRKLERCDCDKGLTCTPVSWAESAKNKGQGVCLPRPRQGQRKTRHSGKKRRTAERSC